MNKTWQVTKYVLSDIVAAASAWILFYTYRKVNVESVKFGIEVPVLFDYKFIEGLLTVTIFWLFIYVLFGTYRNIFRKSRLRELGQTLLLSLIGSLIIFFALLLDDVIINYKSYYMSVLTLFAAHFLLTATGRFLFSSIINYDWE